MRKYIFILVLCLALVLFLSACKKADAPEADTSIPSAAPEIIEAEPSAEPVSGSDIISPAAPASGSDIPVVSVPASSSDLSSAASPAA